MLALTRARMCINARANVQNYPPHRKNVGERMKIIKQKL